MDIKAERPLNPYNEAGIFSKLFFWWLFDLFSLGFRNKITETNLYDNVPDLKSETIVKIFQVKWKKMLIANDSSILKLLFKLYGLNFLLTTILNVSIEAFCKSIQVLSLGELTSYFSIDQNKKSRGEVFYYAAGLVISLILPSLSTNVYIFYVSKIGLKIRLGCSGLVFQKIVENSEKINGLNGKAIAILTNDVRQIINALTFGNFTFLGPFETIILGYLLYLEIGVAAFGGIIFMLLFLPFQFWCACKNVKFFRSRLKFLDERLKITNEIIQNIEIIKIHTWEKYFKNRIEKIRDKELTSLWGTLKIRAEINCLRVVSVIAIFISLLIICYMEKELSARKVFMTSLIFTFINGSMVRFWTTSLTNWSNAFESLKRIREFLHCRNSIHLLSDTKKSNSYISRSGTKGIYLNDVKLAWEKENENDDVKFALYDINLELPDSSFVAITGTVGSGKSTLLGLISGELKAQSGNVEVKGTVSYAAQEPWIFEGTIKENIVFVEDYDEERYFNVLKICALKDDICKFSSGDLSIVGERGVSLSGGQRSRINLARAIYRKADIYLLDDPLSAVDFQVAKHIFDECILKFLHGKICLMVTHQFQHFKNFKNHIIILSNGQIVKKGGFELLNDIKDFMSPETTYSTNFTENREKLNKIERKLELRKEHLEKGSIKLSTYTFLLKMVGNWPFIVFVILITIASTASAAGLNFFLSRWVIREESKHLYQGTNKDFIKIRNEYETIYWCLVSTVIVLYIGRFFIINYACLRICLNIHKSLVNAVLMTSMKFFSLNTSGQIITRFSKDLSPIDSELSTSLQFVIGLLTDVPAAIIITIIVNHWLLIPSIIITIIFWFIRMVFMRTSLPIKRIESSTQSPVNSHINQIFQGLATIRIFKAEKKMEQKFHELQNFCASAFFLDAAVYRCFSLWIEFFCTLYIAIIVYSFLFINDLFSSGSVGLAVFQCISIVQICQFGIKFTADLENQMTGVERIKEYCDLASELNATIIGKSEWPSEACIEFKNFNFKYFDKVDEFILKNLNFKIEAKEKIGIIGRTGSGKSSIVQAITRLAVNEGVIEIGGINIKNLSLTELRANISIIPQVPVLFSGTIRSNLDPGETISDCDLWAALEDVELKVYIKSLPYGLDSKIADCGANLSVGQKQLICVARAILKRNKFLILDEATANVDLETDRLIQKMLSTKFADCTVLSIAHRLDSILKSDRILVMNNGKIIEFDTAENLLNADKNFSKIY